MGAIGNGPRGGSPIPPAVVDFCLSLSSCRGHHAMRRRTLLGTALAVANASPLLAALRGGRWEGAAEVLEQATAAKRVESAVLHVARRDQSFTRHFGKATSGDAMFLLGSISKPINVTAVMTLFDRGAFQLDD